MVTWVLLAGLPGTGKSTLAKALADRLRAAILNKDKVRSALFPGPLTDYSGEQDHLCVEAMLAAAAYLTTRSAGDYIFFDGRTFSARRQVDEVVQAAETAGAGWRILHVVCADAGALERLAATDPAHPAKNRNPELYRRIQQRFEPISRPSLEIDTTEGIDPDLEAIEIWLERPESFTSR